MGNDLVLTVLQPAFENDGIDFDPVRNVIWRKNWRWFSNGCPMTTARVLLSGCGFPFLFLSNRSCYIQAVGMDAIITKRYNLRKAMFSTCYSVTRGKVPILLDIRTLNMYYKYNFLLVSKEIGTWANSRVDSCVSRSAYGPVWVIHFSSFV